MKNPWLVIGVITAVLFGGAVWLSSSSGEKNNEGVEVTQHIKGNPEAEVKLVEYSDFQCPACAAFHPVVQEVMAEYGDRVSLEYKHFPLTSIHRHAQAAAEAAEAAGQQGKFYEFHDLLFENQSTWPASASPKTFFIQYAEQLGLDIPIFKRHMNSSVLREKVRADFNEGRRLNVTGTPSFFINGQKLEYDTFASFIEQVAAAADPASASSTGAVPANPASNVRFGL